MLMRPDVMEKVMSRVVSNTIILMTPRGRLLKQKIIDDLVHKKSLCIICGQYEGFDWRWVKQFVSLELSIGDYILNNGETASKVLIESISRKQKDFMGEKKSHMEESFSQGLLEEDQFTRPTKWRDSSALSSDPVPPVLIGGDFKKVREWKTQNSLFRTWERRPDLLKEKNMDNKDIKYLCREINKRFSSYPIHVDVDVI